MVKWNLGIIGPGLIWQNIHAAIIKKLDQTFAVRAFCARTQKTLDKAQKEYPDADCYLDADELLARKDLDAVVVALPIADNGKMALRALHAGKHVFLEKPMAINGAEANQILEAARISGKSVYVLENFVYADFIQRAKGLLCDGTIGVPVYCDMRFHYIIDGVRSAMDGYALTPWRIEADYPLGAIMDGGIHYFAILTQLFGKPEWIYATGSNLRPTYGAYDHILTVCGFNTSLKVSYSHSGILDGNAEQISVWGTKGYLSVNSNKIEVLPYDGNAYDLTFDPEESHLRMWKHFSDCIQAEKTPTYSIEEGVWSIEMCDAVQKSLLQHQEVIL